MSRSLVERIGPQLNIRLCSQSIIVHPAACCVDFRESNVALAVSFWRVLDGPGSTNPGLVTGIGTGPTLAERWNPPERRGSCCPRSLIVAGHLVPGGRLVPAEGVGVGRVRVDPDARLGEVDLLLQLDRAGESQARVASPGPGGA